MLNPVYWMVVQSVLVLAGVFWTHDFRMQTHHCRPDLMALLSNLMCWLRVVVFKSSFPDKFQVDRVTRAILLFVWVLLIINHNCFQMYLLVSWRQGTLKDGKQTAAFLDHQWSYTFYVIDAVTTIAILSTFDLLPQARSSLWRAQLRIYNTESKSRDCGGR